MRKGFILSIDALMAASIIATAVILMSSMSFYYSSPEFSYKRLYSSGKDSITILEKAKIKSIYDDIDSETKINCEITQNDLNKTLIDMIGYYWAQGNNECATNLTAFIYNSILNETTPGFALLIDGNEIFSTQLNEPDYISRVSTVASGYEKEKVVRGYISKVFITKASRESSTYGYFGGYVGDGNITKNFEIPTDSNVTEFYIEMDIGSNFTLYMNGNQSGMYNITTANMSSDSFTICNLTINPSYCELIKEGNNSLMINFTTKDNNYIGGGYFRIKHKTTEFIADTEEGGSTRIRKHYLPGIKGLINLYSSFYIPGEINSIQLYLHYKNNLSINEIGIPVYFVIGNQEVYRENGTGKFNRTVNDTVLASYLNYSNISKTTVPLRFGIETFLFDFGIGTSDSVLITDRSGSMDDCDVNTEACLHSDCSWRNGCQNQRIDVAKDVDKIFVETMLNVSGNRVGLNGYGESVCSSYKLSNDTDALTSRIDTYDHDCGCTCIPCGIAKAMETIVMGRMQSSLISRNSEWFYNTSYPSSEPSPDSNGTVWYNLTYNDINWTNETAMFGFENSPYSPNIDTDIGNNNGNYYFRKKINITDINYVEDVELFILADDSAEVYLNGHLIFNDTYDRQAEYWNRGGHIFYEGFEEGNLDQWTMDSNNDGGVVELNDEPYEGSANVHFYGDDSATNTIWLQSNGINLTGRQNVTFRYFWATEDLEGSDHGYLDVYDGSWHNGEKEYGYDNGRNNYYTSDFQDYLWEIIDMENYNTIDNFTIRFRATPQHTERWDAFLIDEVSVSEHLIINESYLREGENVVAVKLRNDDSDSAKFDLELNYTQKRYKAITIMSDGDANTVLGGDGCDDSSGAKVQTIQLSCDARDDYGMNIYSIAFGEDADEDTLRKAACWNCSADDWLSGEGEDNCSRYFKSSSAEELAQIYSDIASDIANATYKAQTITASEDISLDNILYPDSYIEFNYTPVINPISYGEITVTYESDRLGVNSGNELITDNETGTKEGWFSIPPDSNILEAKVTSYSSSYWTDRLWVNSSNTPNQNFTNVFWLANFSDDYETLGDPYTINIPVEYLTAGGNNSIKIGTGIIPDNGTGASPDDRVIYTISIGGIGLVGYSDVFPELKGCTVDIYSDTDGDNIADKTYTVSVGPEPSDEFNPKNDSIDDAFMRLLDKLNFIYDSNENNYGTGTALDPYDGVNSTNPIDIEITSDISFNSNFISDVPSLWGPATLEVHTWI